MYWFCKGWHVLGLRFLHFSRKFSPSVIVVIVSNFIFPKLILPWILACKGIWTNIWFLMVRNHIVFPPFAFCKRSWQTPLLSLIFFVDNFRCPFSSVFSTRSRFFVGASFHCDFLVMMISLPVGWYLISSNFCRIYPDNELSDCFHGSWTSLVTDYALLVYFTINHRL